MMILSNRGMQRFWLTSVAVVSTASSPVVHAADAELIDIAARIDYGYYAGDSRVVAGARAELERLRGSSGARDYYLGYSAYRLGQLADADGHRTRRELITACTDAARAALGDPAWAVEGWVLVAACSLEGLGEPVRALGHDLRLSEALDAARGLDADHPRLLLIEALAIAAGDGGVDEIRAKLVVAREQFDAWAGTSVEPTWGRAEVFATLAALCLDDGDRREARDLIEQSLIEAPGYHVALELQNRLSLPRR
jgi:hypothetical protein